MSKVAHLLGKTEEAKKYKQLALKIRDAFCRKFLNPESGEVTGNCQTSMACALYQGLVDDSMKDKVLAALVESVEKQNRHIDCGILGTKYVMNALTENGRADLAYAIATQIDFPSFGYMVKHEATTLWESWDGGASRIHHMFSDVSAWFYKGLAGINIDPSAPGFKNFIIRPNLVAELRWVQAWHNSMYGKIVCNWTIKDDKLFLTVTVPVNCTATVLLPTVDPESVLEDNLPAKNQPDIHVGNFINNRLTIFLESGQYNFTARLTSQSSSC